MSKCPSCGEPVSQFAAGCAICGADLDQARRDHAARRARMPSAPALPRVPEGLVTVGLLLIVTLFLPLLGIILALLAINRQASLSSEAGTRVALFAVAAFGVLLIVSPATRFGVWSLLS